MFARKEKPLPKPVFEVIENPNPPAAEPAADEGIYLGDKCYWNPEALPNGHIVAIGASGSGKTQTLKAIAHELRQTYPDIQVVVIDFHGDQQIDGETCYPLHMASPHGINPLVINLDREGGGPNLQAIAENHPKCHQTRTHQSQAGGRSNQGTDYRRQTRRTGSPTRQEDTVGDCHQAGYPGTGSNPATSAQLPGAGAGTAAE